MPYYTYILTNRIRTVLYTGVTNDLQRRIEEHKAGHPGSFTGRYRVSTLVYYEQFSRIKNAIDREKQIKSWSRKKKNELIESFNPAWNDIYEQLGGNDTQIIWDRYPSDWDPEV